MTTRSGRPARPLPEGFRGIIYRGKLDFIPEHFYGPVKEITGYTEKDFKAGKPSWDKIIHEDDLGALRSSFEQVRTRPVDMLQRDYRIIRKDRSIRWVREIISNICDKSAKPVEVQGVIFDITGQKRISGISMDSWKEVVMNAPEIIITTDRAGRIEFVNRTMEGIDPDKVIGTSIYDYIPEDSREKAASALRHVFVTGTPTSYETTGLGEHGKISWYSTQVGPIKQGRAVRSAVHITSDISKRKTAEDALRVKEWAIETAQNAIAFSDLDGILTYANRAMLDMWGYESQEEVIGKHVTEFWYNREEPEAVINALISEGGWTGELKAMGKDGGVFDVQISASLVRDNEGEPICMMGSFVDISQRKRYEEDLRIKDSAIMTSISGISFAGMDGRIMYANSSFLKMWGYESMGDVVGKSHVHFILDEEKGREILADLGKNGSFSGDIECRKADGTSFEVRCLSNVVSDADGNPVCIMGSFYDITEQKRSEEARRQWAHAFTHAGWGIALGDANGKRLILANPSFARMHGYEEEEVQGLPISSLIVPECQQTIKDLSIVRRKGNHSFESLHVRKDGSLFPVSVDATVVKGDDGRAIYSAFNVQDITVRKESEEKLTNLALIVEQANEGISVSNLDGKLTFVNKACAEMHGYSVDELTGQHIKALHTDRQMKSEVIPFLETIKVNNSYSAEVSHVKKDGTVFPTLMIGTKLTDSRGDHIGMVKFIIDITERKRLESELEQRALYDILTNLPNRVLFMDRLNKLFEQRGRSAELIFALMVLDIDNFKNINDSMGHGAGDELLLEISRRISSVIRPEDTLSRLGGDEFVVILNNSKDIKEIMQTAERIHLALNSPINMNGTDIFTTASIGIAIVGPRYEAAEDLLRDADTAMFHAKASGRNCTRIFHTSMYENVLETMKIESDLHRAIERKEFELYYQPIIDIGTGSIFGFEALIRWRHHERGLINPDFFIPAAEESGMINPIGSWVLKEACTQLARWQDMFPSGPSLNMSVNISAKQFKAGLPDEISGIIMETGIAGGALKLEITENTIIGSDGTANQIITRLNQMGVQVYLDDFGTGYSSLNYIHKFQINALKVDRSFVKDIKANRELREIVKAIVMIGNNLNKNIIIEGIESQEQLAQFRELNCKYMQGFLFSEPLDSVHAENFIRQFYY